MSGHRPFSARPGSPWAPTRTRAASATCCSSPAMGPRERGTKNDPRRRAGRRGPRRRATTSRRSATRCSRNVRVHPRGRGLELGPAGRRDGVPDRHEARLPDLQPALGGVLRGQPAVPHDASRSARCPRRSRSSSSASPRCPTVRGEPMTRPIQAFNFQQVDRRAPPPAQAARRQQAGVPGRRVHRHGRRRPERAQGLPRSIQGEEFFYQLEGDMTLQIIAGGQAASTSRSARATSSCCRRTCRTRRSGPRTRSAW